MRIEPRQYSLPEKCPYIGRFSGPHFPTFGLNVGKYGVGFHVVGGIAANNAKKTKIIVSPFAINLP